MKPYQQISIVECGERLVSIPLERLAVVSPHPYQQLGAPYGDKSPYLLRQTVVDRLLAAQTQLEEIHPGWRIQVFDAYRPVAVQEFMVRHTYETLRQGASPGASEEELMAQVYQFWALPSEDPKTPPPHSTGGAIDLTLTDATGIPIDMGSPVDEPSPRSIPDYFAASSHPEAKRYHTSRELLYQVMHSAGFARHPNEWWHFSWGDQMWAWLTNQPAARYGRV
ncbi:MAG TPA: M15 family metallopeptidase [Oscillatoriaceae cyanobacterium M33_DOE_052]|uniref:D-alanyl-D-alanine dipeptidase n=1 Tax=Planktothricoides sp. SpSt-374 TaxID=2282167 RepID=A0A7C4A0W4_9CYAN|nr:M15 family metallopeptidase [Oscillatoriaceae cyanobacterium M33_DOE_052]